MPGQKMISDVLGSETSKTNANMHGQIAGSIPPPAAAAGCPKCGVARLEDVTDHVKFSCGTGQFYDGGSKLTSVQSDRCRIRELAASIADWQGRAQRQYDENVSMISKLASLEAANKLLVEALQATQRHLREHEQGWTQERQDLFNMADKAIRAALEKGETGR